MGIHEELHHLHLLLHPTSLPPSSSSIFNSDLDKLHVIGGTVYKVRHRRTSALYSLKLLSLTASSNDRRILLRETDILRRTSSVSSPSSPRVVRCYSIFHLPFGDFAVLMEYMDAGHVETLRRRDGPFSESSLSDVVRQVLHRLFFLHSNILVDLDFRVKSSDFGVSKIMCRSLDPCISFVSTCAYMSPERFYPEAYEGNYDGYAADVWCLGYFPLLDPGQRRDWATLMCVNCFGEPSRIPEEAFEEFRGFVECCLQKDTEKRWTVKQLRWNII